ncbi:MAG: hypothetical protein LBQ36_09315 [Synergistaceae bacterium]|jgi:hypothetical protein|nr:hypothetical protein [Synergistaceae bacterium]
MRYERALLFLAGFAAGAGLVAFAGSPCGRKAAVAVASKGLELRDRAAALAERAKESLDDVVAEAKYVNEKKGGSDQAAN